MTSMMHKPMKAIFFVFTAASCLNACSQSQPDYSGTTTVRMYRESETDIITLKIPKGYLDHYVLAGPSVPGAKEETAEVQHQMYFVAEAATLNPRSAENNQAFVYPNSLTDELRFNTSTWHMRSKAERGRYQQYLHESRISTFIFSCVQPPQAKRRYGLEWYEIDRVNCPKMQVPPKSMLIDRQPNGAVRTQIFCTSDEVPDLAEQSKPGRMSEYNPRCNHSYYFEELNVTVTLHYARFYVKDWRQLERRINALLRSFVQTTTTP